MTYQELTRIAKTTQSRAILVASKNKTGVQRMRGLSKLAKKFIGILVTESKDARFVKGYLYMTTNTFMEANQLPYDGSVYEGKLLMVGVDTSLSGKVQLRPLK